MQLQNQSEVVFWHPDAVLLWCVPEAGGSLQELVWLYTFVNRTAPPSHAELEGFLNRASDAGIITLNGDRVMVDEAWHARIHAADGTTPNEIESILEFEEGFYATAWERRPGHRLTLTQERYEAAIQRPR